MCGIAGVIDASGSPPDSAILDRLVQALAHRGPDGQGRHLDGGVGMVQTRLAIIDLETGDQPLYATASGGGRTALVANGEIYNYVELRAAMTDGEFHTRSDCEPPLHLYARHGTGFAAHLRGMYAIAIHDPEVPGGRVVLARDPFGIKPLYYVELEGGLAFASEPQALIAAGLVAPMLDPAQRDQVLQMQFSCGRSTVLKDIRRALPGETLVVDGGRIGESLRSPALPADGPKEWSEAEALERLEEALVDSVSVHQRSDVPYGMFLSGGVDSSAVLALMRDLNDEPVQAFTVGFAGTGVHDERHHAEAVARVAGAHFQAVEFSDDDFWRLLPRIAAVMDDPAADYAVLPSYKLAEEARRNGLKVILTGEGGDELFGGYGRYRRAARHRLLGGRPMRARGTFDGLDVLRDDSKAWRGAMVEAEAAARTPGRSRLQVAQATDCADWLPNDLLAKLDRCLMAFGVEGRTPFLDPRVAEVAFRLPDALKVRSGRSKWLLRRWLERRLPEAKPFTRKRGFTVPVGDWIARQGRRLGSLVADQPGVAEVCRPGTIESLFSATGKRAGQAQWTLLFYALWHRRHILGRDPGGDVFETLAEKG
ncbi:MAG: asparagine synthase (glutamine-hydrolyzing) [Rhodospirillales bacterium]|jgi:asparagine synthase (glutamine-hydrolysing)|nr:asparagine synthase (glutamine-hydrolyzing) [Rhodospirillales bacterium]HJO98067.1 asparagine synthase (glutamine-hydrolyzing) [Rhodospirillales bacterium]